MLGETGILLVRQRLAPSEETGAALPRAASPRTRLRRSARSSSAARGRCSPPASSGSTTSGRSPPSGSSPSATPRPASGSRTSGARRACTSARRTALPAACSRSARSTGAAETARRYAVVEDGLANWPPSADGAARPQRDDPRAVVPRRARDDHLAGRRPRRGPRARRRRAHVAGRAAREGRGPLPRHGRQRLRVPDAPRAHRATSCGSTGRASSPRTRSTRSSAPAPSMAAVAQPLDAATSGSRSTSPTASRAAGAYRFRSSQSAATTRNANAHRVDRRLPGHLAVLDHVGADGPGAETEAAAAVVLVVPAAATAAADLRRRAPRRRPPARSARRRRAGREIASRAPLKSSSTLIPSPFRRSRNPCTPALPSSLSIDSASQSCACRIVAVPGQVAEEVELHLRVAGHQRQPVGELRDELVDGRVELGRRDGAVDEPPLLGLLRGDLLAEQDDLARAAVADEDRQPLRRAGRRHRAVLEADVADERVVDHHRQVARHLHLVAAADADAVDPRDRRLADLADRGDAACPSRGTTSSTRARCRRGPRLPRRGGSRRRRTRGPRR